MSQTAKPFSWGLWALVGFVAWIVVMVAIGAPTLAIAAPAAGVLSGWLVGGLVRLALEILPASWRRRAPSQTPSPRLSGNRAHWERVYRENAPETVSWFEPQPHRSLELIESVGLVRGEAIVDVGGGASRLAAELVDRGHTDVTVLDISAEALERASEQAAQADRVRWVVGDIRTHDFGRVFSLWHDRAAFHFLVDREDRDAYLAAVERTVPAGGHLVVATFGPEAPAHCSGLPVVRYSPESLAEEFGEVATVESHAYVDHITPGGKPRQYLYAHLVRHP